MVRQHSIPCVAFLVALASAVFAPPAHGQTITATLQGVVRDASQAALPGALVTLRERNTGLVRTTTSDTAGSYVLSHLPAGTLSCPSSTIFTSGRYASVRSAFSEL